jgi:carboxylesterase
MLGAEPFHADGGPVGVLLCHGFTGTPQSMRPWADHLAAQGYTVSLPRLPGHGTHWRDANATSWMDWYAEVERAHTDLAGRCAAVFVCGLSMGGTLALRLAQERGDAVAGLVLVNPSVATQRFDAKYIVPVLGRVLPAWKGIGSDIKKPGMVETAYAMLPLKALLSLRELWAAVRADLPRVRQPLLLFRSRVDHVVEPVSSRIVLGGVSSTDTTERVLENSYHVATLDNDAPEIFTRSAEWIGDHAPQPDLTGQAAGHATTGGAATGDAVPGEAVPDEAVGAGTASGGTASGDTAAGGTAAAADGATKG